MCLVIKQHVSEANEAVKSRFIITLFLLWRTGSTLYACEFCSCSMFYFDFMSDRNSNRSSEECTSIWPENLEEQGPALPAAGAKQGNLL